MSEILKKLGDKAHDVSSTLKSLPPSDNEAQGIAETQKQVDTLKGTTAPVAPAYTAPAPTDAEKANPLTRYGSRPGEKRLDTSYADQPTAVKAPVYDRGGEVGIIGGTNNNVRPMPTMLLPAYDNGGEVKKQKGVDLSGDYDVEQTKVAAQPKGGVDLSQDYDVSGKPAAPEYTSRYSAEAAVANRPKVGMPKIHMDEDRSAYQRSPLPMYDEGGEVDVNDGNHEAAILQGGERVLTPEENEQYKADQASKVEDPSPALKTGDAKSTEEGQPLTPTTDESLKLKPYGQVIEDKSNAKAAEKVAAQPEGAAPAEGGSQPQVEEKPKLTYGHLLAEKYGFIPKGFNQGSQGVPNVEDGMTAPAALGQSKPATAQETMKPMNLPAGPVQPNTSSERGGDFKARLAQLQQDHAKALALRTNDGNVQADYIANQINDLKKNNPWGTTGNHPGILGKIGHVAEMVASRAPGLAPIVGTLPGSEMYRANEMRGNREDTKQDEAAVAAEDKANKTAAKAATDDWKLNPNVVGPNGRAVLENSKTGETKEAPEGYTAYDKPVHESDKEQYMSQWYKDHPDAVKSTANDDKAIQQMATAQAAAGQENKAKGKIYYYDTPNGRQGYTYSEAQAAGLKPEDGYAVAAAQADKDRKSNDTYESLKTQLGQYKGNIAKSANSLLPSDVDNMASMIESVESPDYVSKIVTGAIDDLYGKPVTGYNEKVMKGALTKKAYDAMSPAARQLVADYFTTLLAHFGNVKATLGQVPRNEKLITTEMNMIPKPYLNAAEAEPAFNNYTAQVERNNAHNVKFGNAQSTAPAAEAKPAEQNQGFKMTSEEQNIAKSITLPDGSHPAAVHKDPANGKVLLWDGKSDYWTDAAGHKQ